jgi:hypothetical protein
MPDQLERWAECMETELIPGLQADPRFQNSQKLVDLFHEKVAAWRNGGGEIKQIIEIGNELTAAESLLGRMATDETLEYEPRMAGSRKRRAAATRGSGPGRGPGSLKE